MPGTASVPPLEDRFHHDDERPRTKSTGVAEAAAGMKVGMFEPKEFKGGRVKVYGCSPGCLAVSIGLSLLLTLAINGCIRLF
jgi:hypothetical protein